jgi:hypothetical protein
VVFCAGDKILRRMTSKDTRLTFRIRSELKKELELLASDERRSVAQICEAFLQAGLAGYKKEGAKFLQRFLPKPK